MNLPLQTRNAQLIETRVRRRPRIIEDAVPETGSEAVSIWFGLGLPLVTFCCWLAGLLFLHPWVGFLTGIAVSLVIARRLTRK